MNALPELTGSLPRLYVLIFIGVTFLVFLLLPGERGTDLDRNQQVLRLSDQAMITNSTGPEHIVFIGDSLTRYSFLALQWRIQNPTEPVPNYLVSEKVYSSWSEFYHNSTSELRGVCQCDCFRTMMTGLHSNIDTPFTAMRENRYCRYGKAQNSIAFTYIQLFGDTLSMHGTTGPRETSLSAIHTQQQLHKWNYTSIHELLTDFIAQLQPKPSALVLSTGAWPHERIQRELAAALEAAKNLTDNVFWLESAPPKETLKSNPCANISHPLDIDLHARSLCAQHLCAYLEFPTELPVHLLDKESCLPAYWDNLHFSSGEVYDFWNLQTLTKMCSAMPCSQTLSDIFYAKQPILDDES